MPQQEITYDETTLLSGVNAREREVFGILYSLLFDELYYYASKLYQDTEIDAGDVIQDVFLAFWQSNNYHFSALSNVKAYILVAIQNRFKKYLRQNNSKHKFLNSSVNELNRFQSDIFETEIFSLFHQVMNMLPEETAEIFKLFFMGWTADEIAKHLNKSKQTIYNIKSQALTVLREKLSKDAMLILISMLYITD